MKSTSRACGDPKELWPAPRLRSYSGRHQIRSGARQACTEGTGGGATASREAGAAQRFATRVTAARAMHAAVLRGAALDRFDDRGSSARCMARHRQQVDARESMATTTTWVGSGDVRVTGQGPQTAPGVAALAGGGYVIAWLDDSTGTSQLHAQRFDAGGNKVGGETLLSAGPAYGDPSLVALADGSFVATWDARSDAAAPTNYVGQHFDAAGSAIGGVFQANSLPDYDTSASAQATALAGGGWVVEWSQNTGSGWDPQIEVYAAGGAAAGANQQLGAGLSDVHSAAIAATSDGGFVSVWAAASAYQPGSGMTDHVYLQRFDAAGHALATPVEVMTQPSSSYVVSGVETAVLAGSGAVVVSTRGLLPDGRTELIAQGFNAAGQALTGQQTIVSATAVLDSKVTALADGSFVVSWLDSQTQQQTTLQTVYAQRFDASGAKLGDQVLVGTSQGLYPHYTVSATPDGGAVFAWDDGRVDGADVFSQLFTSSSSGDHVPPTVVVFAPADEAANVPVNSNIVVTFSEAVQRGAGTIVLHDAAGHVVASYDAATSSNIAISGATLTIDPSADLAPGTAYAVDFAPGSVVDLSGNAYAGTTTYNFTTAAGTAPPGSITGTSGDDTLVAGTGNVSIDGGAGTDTVVIAAPVSGVQAYSYANGVLSVTTANGSDTIVNVERVKLSDALFALDTQAPDANQPGGHVWQAAALFHAGFGTLPGIEDLSHWTAVADHAGSMGALAQQMIDTYAPGISSASLVAYLYQQLVHVAPGADVVQSYVDQIGPGRTFATQGDLVAYAAALPLNTDHIATIVGTFQQLDPAAF
jgi:methionine-rich copper-binding protein CopC